MRIEFSSLDNGPDLPQPGDLVGEAVERPDGVLLTCHKEAEGIAVHLNGITATYYDDQVITVGGGDWRTGAFRLLQAYYRVDVNEMVIGGTRLFEEELSAMPDSTE
jgi:hypothetical protein